ncbi:MAG: hypothetical protein H6Q07_1771 [Acidobacteria bacterium]|nr:hypothetical protein [Acidobacteriota bacterium]
MPAFMILSSTSAEQHVCMMLYRRSGPFYNINFSNSCKYHGFHEFNLLLSASTWILFPVSLEKKCICSNGQ